MSWRLDDRWLWLGLGVFTIVAVQGVGYALRETLRLTEIHEKPLKPLYAISQETEDALEASSLAVLAQSHDRAIRASAIKILADRFLRDQSLITSLTIDIVSPNADVRAEAQNLRRLLEQFASDLRPIAFLSHAESNARPLPRPPVSRLREHEESPEEQQLRRRRREAMVFHDGGGPVSQADIIQRTGNGSPILTRSDTGSRILEDRMREITATRGISSAQ